MYAETAKRMKSIKTANVKNETLPASKAIIFEVP